MLKRRSFKSYRWYDVDVYLYYWSCVGDNRQYFCNGYYASNGNAENIIEISVHYARILFISMPVLFLYFAYTTFMRGTGDSKTPFYFLIVSTALNMILLPILIFGWLGAPKLDVYGALCICYIYSYYVYCHACVFKEEKSPITTRWNG